MSKHKTCALYTLGCKVNQYETQCIREKLAKAGYREQRFSDACDLYVVNTCTVTAKTDKESRRAIREAFRRNPNAAICVTGCYVERDMADIQRLPGRLIIARNSQKNRIAQIIDGDLVPNEPGYTNENRYTPLTVSDLKNRTKAFLKIQDGCDNFCSYCKVPLVRGRSRSRDSSSVLAELRRLVARGFKEIVLTGICLGAWGHDFIPLEDFSNLLRKMVRINGDFRVRLSSIEPKFITPSLLSTIASSPKICKHLHMPFQSGDDDVLAMMKRPYTSRAYLDIVKMVRKVLPDASITTDILVGFPGETEKQFVRTCRFVERVRPLRVHIFSYSKREGTAAALLKGTVPKLVVKQRVKIMEHLASRISYDYRRRFLQRKTSVLVESKRDENTGMLRGYDDKYFRILVSGPDRYKSTLTPVRIEKIDRDYTLGALFS